MKGSTRGARHLAESTNWLAWHRDRTARTFGSLMETALAHWELWRAVEFFDWAKGLPE